MGHAGRSARCCAQACTPALATTGQGMDRRLNRDRRPVRLTLAGARRPHARQRPGAADPAGRRRHDDRLDEVLGRWARGPHGRGPRSRSSSPPVCGRRHRPTPAGSTSTPAPGRGFAEETPHAVLAPSGVRDAVPNERTGTGGTMGRHRSWGSTTSRCWAACRLGDDAGRAGDGGVIGDPPGRERDGRRRRRAGRRRHTSETGESRWVTSTGGSRLSPAPPPGGSERAVGAAFRRGGAAGVVADIDPGRWRRDTAANDRQPGAAGVGVRRSTWPTADVGARRMVRRGRAVRPARLAHNNAGHRRRRCADPRHARRVWQRRHRRDAQRRVPRHALRDPGDPRSGGGAIVNTVVGCRPDRLPGHVGATSRPSTA